MGTKTSGFASMTPERRREIATRGGKEVQARGTGHQFDSKSGKAAGKLGGAKSRGGRGQHQSTATATHPRAK